jgi:hypothetical protein
MKWRPFRRRTPRPERAGLGPAHTHRLSRLHRFDVSGAARREADDPGALCRGHRRRADERQVSRTESGLTFNLPPGHMKSLLISILFTDWRLGVNPSEWIICASYSDDLAHQPSRLTRQVMQSRLYRRILPGTVLDKKAQDSLTSVRRRARSASLTPPMCARLPPSAWRRSSSRRRSRRPIRPPATPLLPTPSRAMLIPTITSSI